LLNLSESDSFPRAYRLGSDDADLFWLSDTQWAVIEPFMPTKQPTSLAMAVLGHQLFSSAGDALPGIACRHAGSSRLPA
jgi:hypothetical protein